MELFKLKVCIVFILFSLICSLESPFRQILNAALKHEEKNYECSILSKDCPFNNKKFVQKIELGEHIPKEFMDEIMETVISDLNKPLQRNNSRNIKKEFIKYEKGFIKYSGNMKNMFIKYWCNTITALLIALSVSLALNFVFGFGKICRQHASIHSLHCTCILFLQFVHLDKMDLVVTPVKMDFLENHMNGMDLILLAKSALHGHAHVKKIMMVHIVMIVPKVFMDISVIMVFFIIKYSLFVVVFPKQNAGHWYSNNAIDTKCANYQQKILS